MILSSYKFSFTSFLVYSEFLFLSLSTFIYAFCFCIIYEILLSSRNFYNFFTCRCCLCFCCFPMRMCMHKLLLHTRTPRTHTHTWLPHTYVPCTEQSLAVAHKFQSQPCPTTAAASCNFCCVGGVVWNLSQHVVCECKRERACMCMCVRVLLYVQSVVLWPKNPSLACAWKMPHQRVGRDVGYAALALCCNS